ncbi:coagulation factor XIII B chain-like isoform X3 [Protopterus annectens]|uniref:coagulation factor XIII B chain-like isoform X3 n=1 Tax=Protopterus annectens TaxID=7888 RepID=UPI001CFB12E9|nr:coagulation factor XIII B chain-like isoform X3 [Protopterus annectens]
MCSCVRFEGINTNMFRFIFTLILWTLTVAEEENGIQCKIPNIEHGQYKTADGLVKFSCNPGYVLNGTRISQCHYIGWYPSPPICQEFECGTPPETTYGVYLPKKNSYKIGENVTYICNRSYTIYGDETVTCTAQGWSSLPSCETAESLECEEPPHINHGEIVEIKLAPHVNEEIVMYQCSEKYKLQGNPKAVCLNGKWSNIPTCVAESLECEELPRIRHGDIIEMILPPYKNGLTITVQCSKNYKLQGNSKIQCLDGIWTTLPKCLEPCTVTVDIMEKNKIKLRWTDTRKIYVEHNDVLEFECKQGFTAAQGTAMRASCKDGSFNYPFCI